MVPSAFVHMEAFPLSPNGKVDRRALPVPEVTGIESDEPYVAPRNQTENVLAHIWSEVLGIKRVGIHDNFFELGGHSLLTLQVLAGPTARVSTLPRNRCSSIRLLATLLRFWTRNH